MKGPLSWAIAINIKENMERSPECTPTINSIIGGALEAIKDREKDEL